MALGGGSFSTQNKILPGAYLNFVSAAKASADLSERGIVAFPMELDWGISGEVFLVQAGEFQASSQRLFGYGYQSEKLKGIRDLFQNARALYVYRLNGGGEKAKNEYATAKYEGIRGNELRIVIQENVDVAGSYEVKTLFGLQEVDRQTVRMAKDLLENEYVVFQKDAVLTVTTGVALQGGTNGTVDGSAHETFLSKIEPYSFHALGAVVMDAEAKGLYAAFCKRMREEAGKKFQTVLYQMPADYEGCVNVRNKTLDVGWSEASFVYWVTGIVAGCAVNASILNRQYRGEFQVQTEDTQMQLEKAMEAGEFILHRVGTEQRVLSDRNCLLTFTEEKGELFRENQTIRVMDQIANDIALLFQTRYLGIIPNDANGRVSLWSDLVKHHQRLQELRAIEGFDEKDIVVAQGETKKAVVVQDKVTVVNAMAQLYMTVTVG